MTAATYLFLSLPFLLSLTTKGANPKVLGFVTSGFAILLSVEPGGAILPWATGMTVVSALPAPTRLNGSPHGPCRHILKKKGAAEKLPPRPIYCYLSLVQG